MSFACPECSDQSSLGIQNSLELPPDADWDEVALQVIRCGNCAFFGLAVYRESRRGALDREIIHHTGYRLPPEQAAQIARQIASCPKPSDRDCGCRSHLRLSGVNESGRWAAVEPGARTGTFPMQLER